MGGAIHLLLYMSSWRRNFEKYVHLSKKTEGEDHLGDTGADGRLILKWIFQIYDMNGTG